MRKKRGRLKEKKKEAGAATEKTLQATAFKAT